MASRRESPRQRVTKRVSTRRSPTKKSAKADSPFHCKYCSETFVAKNDKHVHEVEVHWRNMLLECEVCAKAFLMGSTPDAKHKCALRQENAKSKVSVKVEKPQQEESDNEDRDDDPDFVDDSWSSDDDDASNVKESVRKLKNKKLYVCRFCGKNLGNINEALNHQQGHHSSSLQCHMCHLTLPSKRDVIKHLDIHRSEKWHFCSVCICGYQSEAELDDHMLSHSTKDESDDDSFPCDVSIRKNDQDKSYSCLKCSVEFPTIKALVLHHTAVHPEMKTNANIHTCRYCLLPFEGEEAYQYHVNNFHPRNHTCNTCGKAFVRPCELRVHAKFHLEIREFKCQYCPKAFKRQTHLNCHLTTHTGERPYTCAVCGKSFKAKRTLLGHESIHSGSEPYQCKDCGLKFTLKSSLLKHEELHALQGLRFKCPKCEKDFSSTSTLAVHDKSVHQKLRHCVCETCGAGFTFKSHLKKHQMVHNGEKPFKCRFCEKYFRVSYSRTLHERQHTGRKPFTCSICCKSYATKNRLERHEKTHSRQSEKNELEIDEPEPVPMEGMPGNAAAAAAAAADVMQINGMVHKDTFQKGYPGSALTAVDKSFEQRHFYVPSMHNHYNTNGFQCHMCGFICQTHEELIRHQQSHSVTQLEPHGSSDAHKYHTADTVGVMLSFINNVQ